MTTSMLIIGKFLFIWFFTWLIISLLMSSANFKNKFKFIGSLSLIISFMIMKIFI